MDERDPVDQSEYIYRRIHRNYVQAGLTIAVQREAFRPTQNDSTGLSVFRASFVQAVDTLATLDPVRAKEYYVARLAVKDLQKLGLTIVPDPIAGGPLGHALIPQLTRQRYLADKSHWKPILAALAKLASADIVHEPS